MKGISPRAAVAAALLSIAPLAAFAQTVEEVGDPDSFGRDMTYLGLASVDPFYIQANCAPIIEAGLECVPPVAGQQMEFASTRTDSIQLPARASNSLLCFGVTPSITRRFNNTTATNQTAVLNTRGLFTIESSVLQDLTNPVTGLPFNGKIELTMTTNAEGRLLSPGEFDTRSAQVSRTCQGSLVSKRTLIDTYGLTQAQANTFFNRAITVRIGLSGTARSVETMVYGLGLRLYGDRR